MPRAGRRLVVASALTLALLALVVLASPRHRSFYLRWAGQAPTLDPAAIVRAVRGTPASAAIAIRRQVSAPDAIGLSVPMSDDPPLRLPAEGVPPGWELREFAGNAEVGLVRGERGLAFHLRSTVASFALHRDLVVSLDEFPVLAWSWKVIRLPTGGDVRERGRDDQAAQVYVIFPRWPSPRTQSDVIGYVWDTTAPMGTTLPSPKAPNVRIIVVQSGPARLGTWQNERRDVAADYRALFGHRAPRVGAIAVMIDANDTASAAEAMIGDLMFERATQKE